MKEFRVNTFPTLRLENGKSNIYVNDHLFIHCKYILTRARVDDIFNSASIDELSDISIDTISEALDHLMESNRLNVIDLPEETRFWVHCSNLQMWAENNYDTRLLHSNLSFPLLKKLTEIGDPFAKRVFKEEIAKRLSYPFFPVITYLINEGYVRYLDDGELNALLKRSVKGIVRHNNHELLSLISKSLIEEEDFENLLKFEKVLSFDLYPMIGNISNMSHGFNLDIKTRKVNEISLINKRLKTIPKSIAEFKDLEKLNLSRNKLTTISDEICQLKHLRKLVLLRNLIRKLPEAISNLENLEILDLSYNNLEELTNSFKYLKFLKKIFLHKNEFLSFPRDVCNLKSLETLSFNNKLISKKKIQEIPIDIGNLKNLRVLELQSNYIKTLPDSMCKLDKLEELNISRNSIEELPNSISFLSNLKSLVLFKNPLRTLPDSLLRLENLQIRVDRTQYNNFPLDVKKKFKNLIYIIGI